MDLKDSLIEYYNKTNNMAIKKVEYNEEDLIEYAVFEIHFKYEPTKKAMDFLEQVMKLEKRYLKISIKL